MDRLEHLIIRVEGILERVECLLPPLPAAADWDNALAFYWVRTSGQGYLKPVHHTHRIHLDDLLGIEKQKVAVLQNTRQFIANLPANNVLVWGSRGTGKSSLIKAVLHHFAGQGLRLIEVDKHCLVDLPDIVQTISARPEKFILYCDDLSFEENDPAYKSLKVVLDGSIGTPSDNILIYATSNRRHLLPEYLAENQTVKHQEGEIHFAEAVEEKLSLSERFGLWLSFHPFNQEQYLQVVEHWLQRFGGAAIGDRSLREEALRWALHKGSRSGRTAWQFARDWAGRSALATELQR